MYSGTRRRSHASMTVSTVLIWYFRAKGCWNAQRIEKLGRRCSITSPSPQTQLAQAHAELCAGKHAGVHRSGTLARTVDTTHEAH